MTSNSLTDAQNGSRPTSSRNSVPPVAESINARCAAGPRCRAGTCLTEQLGIQPRVAERPAGDIDERSAGATALPVDLPCHRVLPTPCSPWIRTAKSVGATFLTKLTTLPIDALSGDEQSGSKL